MAAAWKADGLAVSAISYWEVEMFRVKNRIALAMEVRAWRNLNLLQGVREIPLDGAMGARAASLEEFHPDPADRYIVATALERGFRLMTADRRILTWPGRLERIDATR